jgi:hypothetical protein
MNFTHNFSLKIDRMVMKAQILSKTIQERKMAQRFTVEKKNDVTYSIDDKTAKIALTVQIMKNGDTRI